MAMQINLTPSKVIGGLVAATLIGVTAWFIYNPGLFSKLWIVVAHNWVFWVAMSGGVAWALYRRYKKPDELLWGEIALQIVTSSLSVLLFFSLFYYHATDLNDREVWNSFVVKAEFWEEWTERIKKECCDDKQVCSGTSCSTQKDCRDCSYNQYHPPEWKIITSTGEKEAVDQATFNHYVGHWKNKSKEHLMRANQVSIGDGNMFYTVQQGGDEKRIPAALPHQFVNYLKGSAGSIRKRTGGNTKPFKDLLMDYPKIYTSDFGPIELNRVLNGGTAAPSSWQHKLDHNLDFVFGQLGKPKQVNGLVYLVNTPDQAFLHALEEHWVGGKKNDVIVIIGAPFFPKIKWVAVMAWTDNEQFKIELRDRIYAIGDLTEAEGKIADIMKSQIAKPAEAGGFKRRPMEEMTYLAADIELPVWAVLLVLLISGALSFATGWALENNEIKDGLRGVTSSFNRRYGNGRW